MHDTPTWLQLIDNISYDMKNISSAANDHIAQNEIMNIVEYLLRDNPKIQPMDTHHFPVVEGPTPYITFIPSIFAFEDALDDSLRSGNALARIATAYGELYSPTQKINDENLGQVYNYAIKVMDHADRFASRVIVFLCNYSEIVFLLVVRVGKKFKVHYTKPIKFMMTDTEQVDYTSEGLQYLTGMLRHGFKKECELVNPVIERLLPSSKVTIHRFLGHGATANMFEVTRKGQQNKEAMKLVVHKDHIDHFKQEANFLQNASGIIGIPKLFAAEPNTLYMQVVKRITVEHWTRKRMQDLVAIVKAVHEKGVIHRDIRPSNIGLDGDQIVILDWGFHGMENQRSIDLIGIPVFSAYRTVCEDKYEMQHDYESLLKTFCYCRYQEVRDGLLPIFNTRDVFYQRKLAIEFWDNYMIKHPQFMICLIEICSDDPYAALNVYISSLFE